MTDDTLAQAVALAAKRGDAETLRTLCAEHGGEIGRGSADPTELTPLHLAAAVGAEQAVLFLLSGAVGADVNARRNNAFSPLHAAATNGQADVCAILLEHGAEVDAQTAPQGYCPLHSAAWGGHIQAVQVLLRHGARTDLRNYRGETPRDTASRQGHAAVAAELDHGRAHRKSPRVKHIAWGKMEVEAVGPGRDMKLWPGGGRGWDWRETGTHHVPGILVPDVEELLVNGASLVVLSRGMQLVLQVHPETLDFLRERGIRTHVLETREATALYNRLADAGEAVGGLFHSTC